MKQFPASEAGGGEGPGGGGSGAGHERVSE